MKATRILSAFFTVIMLLTLPIAAPPVFALESGWEIDYSDYDWTRLAGDNVTLNVYNWGEYMSLDGGDGEFDVNGEFEKLTGIKVNYTNFASNEELYAKLHSGGSTYDILIPSDYMIGRLIDEGLLEKLDFDNIPNFGNVFDIYKSPEYDPANEYSVPYLSGIIGIVYNTTLVDEDDDVETWDILWDEKYANNILMFSNSRDAFMISCMRLGYSSNTINEDELREAAEELKKQKLLVQAYVMDEIYDKMGGGEAALAPYYGGDAATMISDNPDLAFAVPREGTNHFVDALCIPKGSKNKEAAEIYINFLCETLVSLKNSQFVGYMTPIRTAYETLTPEQQADTLVYPTEEILANTEIYTTLSPTATNLMDSLWTEILSEVGTSPWMTPVVLIAAVGISLWINIRRYVNKKTATN